LIYIDRNLLCIVAGTLRSIQVVLAWRTKEPRVIWIHYCRRCFLPTSYERHVRLLVCVV